MEDSIRKSRAPLSPNRHQFLKKVYFSLKKTAKIHGKSVNSSLSSIQTSAVAGLENFQNILKISGKYQEASCKAAEERK